jgi:hypothetical protein
MPDPDELQPGARTFNFADAAGTLYRVVYGRDLNGRLTWRFYQPDGHGSAYTDFTDGPEPTEAEAAESARRLALYHVALGPSLRVTRSERDSAEVERLLRETAIVAVP